MTGAVRDQLAWGSLDTPVGKLSVACTAAGVAEVTYAARRRPAASPRPAVLARGDRGGQGCSPDGFGVARSAGPGGRPPGTPHLPEPPAAAALAAAEPSSPAGMLLSAALGELAEYFAGRRRSFSVPVDLSATSGARRTVLSVLHDSVGFGETVTYGALAGRAGLTDGGHPREPKGCGGDWTEERGARNERRSDEGRSRLPSAPEASGKILPPARVVGQVMASNPCAVIVPCHRVVAGGGLGGYSGGAGPEIKRWLLVFEGALPPTLDWSPEGVALRG